MMMTEELEARISELEVRQNALCVVQSAFALRSMEEMDDECGEGSAISFMEGLLARFKLDYGNSVDALERKGRAVQILLMEGYLRSYNEQLGAEEEDCSN